METSKEINAKSKTSGRLNNLVAISVALLAAFMVVTKVKDDNIVQAMLWLLWLSWLIAAVGVIMGVGGLLGLRLHPDWLTRLLS